MDPNEEKPGIVFFDVETTVPTRPGQGFAILEFGAILVCPRKLEELDSYSTLVRPTDLSLISSLSVRCNGITRDAVVQAPTFQDISDKVYNFLHGRIWAGHNIVKFDCARIREAFAEIGKPAPETKGTIDSLALLTQRFGRRAGDMKMASLATYFNLGQQTHRSLDDVRMNLEVVKHCATVLFLESSLPDIFTANSWVSPNATTRSRSNGKVSPNGTSLHLTSHSSSFSLENDSMISPRSQRKCGGHATLSPLISNMVEEAQNSAEPTIVPLPDAFDMGSLRYEVEIEHVKPDVTMEERPVPDSPELAHTANGSDSSSDHVGFLEPDEVSLDSIGVTLGPLHWGIQKIKILHKDVSLQLSCPQLKVRFGISTKFVDHAGRPRLSFVADASPSLCRVLDACDEISQRLSADSGSSSEWRPVVIRKGGYFNCANVRLHIPTTVVGDNAVYETEIYQKEASGTVQKLLFSRVNAAELDTLLNPGTCVHAYISVDPYDYQQNAGIRLVAKKLIVQSA